MPIRPTRTRPFCGRELPRRRVRHVLEQVRDPLATLREVSRIIEPGGHLKIRARGSAHAQPARPFVIAAATTLMPVCTVMAAIESLAGRGGAIQAWAEPK